MKKIFCRGLNFHGQCGLGRDVKYSIDKFVELPLPVPIKNIYTNLAHSFALSEDEKSVYYWGFNWDIRSFFRTSMILQMFPRTMNNLKVKLRLILFFTKKKFWGPLKNYPMSPSFLHSFNEKIVDIQVGGAHCLFLDSNFLPIFYTN
jgi:alpha-tubulin suppressor-like RCC1 family protein